jgi:ATP-dependent Clp protease ATP-binding subunit ClpB
LTEQTRAAVVAAMALANRHGHGEVAPLHLATALLEPRDGLARRLVSKAGSDPDAVHTELSRALGNLSRHDPAPAQPPLAAELVRMLVAAVEGAKKAGDGKLAADRLLAALLEARPVARAAALHGLSKAGVDTAINVLRQGRSADGETPEERFDALAKYGRDLVAAAREGKLDPVIGRDDEIRRGDPGAVSGAPKTIPVLIGEPGCGQNRDRRGPGAAHRRRGRAGRAERPPRSSTLDVAALLAGAKYPRRVRGTPQLACWKS